MCGCGGGILLVSPTVWAGSWGGRRGTHTGTHTHTEERTRKCCTYPLSETGRIRFRGVRFQTPNSVSFFSAHWVPGSELSEFLSAYYLCARANSPSFWQNSPSLPQNSVSSLFRNSTLETVFRYRFLPFSDLPLKSARFRHRSNQWCSSETRKRHIFPGSEGSTTTPLRLPAAKKPYPEGPKIEEIQDFAPGLKFSSDQSQIEIFNRDWTFRIEIENKAPFVGNYQGRDWNFQARLKISIVWIENFNRMDWNFHAINGDWIFSIAGPSG